MKHYLQLYWPLFVASILWLGLITPLAAKAVPLDSCEIYLQVEKQMKCGPQGYVQSFGYPYCQVFLRKNKSFSRFGQKILKNIRLCLQEVILENGIKMSCAELSDYGFSTHEYCYLASGFCRLPLKDKLRVFWLAGSEILNPAILSTALNVEKACLHSSK